MFKNLYSRIVRLHTSQMASKVTMDQVKLNADIARQSIEELKHELSMVSEAYSQIRLQHLKEENAKLIAAVENAKIHLINLETQRGRKQIGLPDNKETINTTKNLKKEIGLEQTQSEECDSKVAKASKENTDIKNKNTINKLGDFPIDVGRLDLRVGKITEVQKHPSADTLFLLKVDCGESNLRTVCSGLVNFIELDDLKNLMVVLLCNLKPVKMRGISSEAMVMCASTSDVVEVLSPPEGSEPGDLIVCDGYVRQPDPVMNPKKKIFETVAPDLHTNDALQACYKNIPLQVESKGYILAKTLKNVHVK